MSVYKLTNKEYKELFVKDLCARFPYGVKVSIKNSKNHSPITVCEVTREYICIEGGGEKCFSHGTYQSYLRPMSSMTDEEREEFRSLGGVMSYSPQHDHWAISALSPDAYDWLNENMFDYRGLIIDEGLVLEAPEGMYKIDKYETIK